MKKMTYYCDRCGNEIKEYSHKIIVEKEKIESGNVTHRYIGVDIEIGLPELLEDADYWESKIDLCNECIMAIETEIVNIINDPKGIKSAAEKIMAIDKKEDREERNRRIIEQKESGDYTLKQIAEMNGCSEATVSAVCKNHKKGRMDN